MNASVPGHTVDTWQRIADLGPFAVLLAAIIAFAAAMITFRHSHRQADRALAQQASEHAEMLRAEQTRSEQDRQDALRTAADRDRAAWWSQAQWALTMTASGKASEREMGMLMLPSLLTSSLADGDQKRIIEQVLTRMLQL